MKLAELLNIISDPDRLRIIQNRKERFIGYLGTYKTVETTLTGEEEVEKLRVIPEIRHKRWQELGLDAPMQPEQMAEYSFSDLELKLYYTITLK